MSTATLSQRNDQREATQGVGPMAANWEEHLEVIGQQAIRFGLVVVLLWIGAMKFTAYEAQGISGLVANSPLLSWVYQVFSLRQFSAILGVTELLIALLIATRPFSARLSAAGSVLAVGMFVTTLTFLFSTPGVFEASLGFPALSVIPGQFLLKDLVLLGAALWTAGEALQVAKRNALLQSAALQGYDPVAYFTLNQPTRGKIEFTARYQGNVYHFASQQHKEMFDAEPEKYLPQYDGYCAFGVAVGQLFDVDPRTGQVIDGKLYVNLNKKILGEFNKDPRGHIDKADANWPGLQSRR
jgi:uncharacterized membrane protein YkgB/YHS domain-containing protein